MRVLHLISSIGFFGAENVLLEIAKEVRHTNLMPIVGVIKNLYNPHVEIADEAKRHDLPVEIFSCNSKLDPKTIILIRQFLNRNRIDIIHSHGYKSNLYALASSLGRNISLVTTCHNWLGDSLKTNFYCRLDKLLLKRFHKIIAVSDLVKNEILNHMVSTDNVLTISNGINLDRFNNCPKTDTIRKQFGIEEGYTVVGTAGRISEEKGHIYLLRAAEKVLRQYPKTVFLIVGDGPMRHDLQKISAEYAKSCCSKCAIIFPGVRTDMPDIYSLMDIFVLPSLMEGLPLALLEAMASKKPVIATRVGAVPKVIADKGTGLLVNPADEGELADAIIYLLEKQDAAKKIAERAYKKVKDDFSSRRMAEQYIDVYEEVLKRKLKI